MIVELNRIYRTYYYVLIARWHENFACSAKTIIPIYKQYVREVFAILKETEKAVYAVLNLGYFFHKTMWIPKSVLIENETHYDHETWQFDSYDEAIYAFKAMWEMYA